MLPNVIAAIYQHDTTRFVHLAGKARFLKKHPARATLVFATWGPGHGIEDSKAGLRLEFPSSMVPNSGQHDHLFHAADAAWDSWRLLRIIEGSTTYLRTLDALRGGRGGNLREYPATESFMGNLQIDELRINVLTGTSSGTFAKVPDTPHYRFLLGHENEYRKYLEKHLGYGIRNYHSVSRFRSLASISELTPITARKNGDFYSVLDGAHRAAILAHRGEGEACARILK